SATSHQQKLRQTTIGNWPSGQWPKRHDLNQTASTKPGAVHPDFLADGRVAVEVRRLNQNHDSGRGKRGLEETSIPLWQRVEKLAHSFGPATNESWFLFFRFGRPIKPWKELEPRVRAA